MWLEGFGADEERPDKSRIVVGIDEVDGIGTTVTIYEGRPGAFDTSKLAHEWLRRGINMRLPIYIQREHGRETLLIPKAKALPGVVMAALQEHKVAVHRYSHCD